MRIGLFDITVALQSGEMLGIDIKNVENLSPDVAATYFGEESIPAQFSYVMMVTQEVAYLWRRTDAGKFNYRQVLATIDMKPTVRFFVPAFASNRLSSADLELVVEAWMGALAHSNPDVDVPGKADLQRAGILSMLHNSTSARVVA